MADLQKHDALVERVAKARKEASRRPERNFGTLNSTLNGNKFYIYSGVMTGGASEFSIISVPNIGEKDIFIAFEVAVAAAGGSDFKLKFKVNNKIILQDYTRNLAEEYGFGRDEYRFIIPANSSLQVTLEDNGGSANANWSVSGYGDYL